MSRNAWLGVLVAVGVLTSAGFAVRARRQEQAEALTARALRLLHPPLSEAASLRDVRGKEARELLEEAQAISEAPERAELISLARANELYVRGRYAEAERALGANPLAHVEATQLMAAIKLMRGKASEAHELMTRSASHDSSDPRAAVLRSDIARALGRGDVALASVEPFLSGADANATLYERRGLAYELLGERKRALSDLARAAELDARGVSALLALGRLQRESGALSAAILSFHEASQRDPNDAEAWLGAGVCRAALGDNIAARIDLERAAAAAPTRVEPLIALADIDVAERNLAGALGRYHAALLLEPKNTLARVKLANTLMRAGEVAAAVPEYRAALSEQPDLAAAHNGLGAALFAQGDLPGAEAELKSAAELDPKDPHPWLNLARLYKKQGDESAQASALQLARARDPALALADRR
jgi:tetratricopeptide (TPR) repeat protein